MALLGDEYAAPRRDDETIGDQRGDGRTVQAGI
jgi:hypothetical protein